ncbi:hypothetical protein E4T44_00809 [Aureobasidium sp. EXF-8845]|nr:hypothetical protein E4T44_00809 [Aureobasidium sp. EXF-8845]KAI4857773.1 hypothetical protein E4T45_00725 [Aureobasidium sp. EXF-8846]
MPQLLCFEGSTASLHSGASRAAQKWSRQHLVQTELHDEKQQPDIKNGAQIGMPLEDFIEATWAGFVAGKDQIPVGVSEESFNSWEQERQRVFHSMNAQ